ncbi:MAG: hypothetical protein ABI147_13675 [Acidobacteriaceae bacterium]
MTVRIFGRAEMLRVLHSGAKNAPPQDCGSTSPQTHTKWAAQEKCGLL